LPDFNWVKDYNLNADLPIFLWRLKLKIVECFDVPSASVRQE